MNKSETAALSAFAAAIQGKRIIVELPSNSAAVNFRQRLYRIRQKIKKDDTHKLYNSIEDIRFCLGGNQIVIERKKEPTLLIKELDNDDSTTSNKEN